MKENGSLLEGVGNIVESVRLRRTCDRLGIPDRGARLLVHIHLITERGKQGIEVFENIENYYKYVQPFVKDKSEIQKLIDTYAGVVSTEELVYMLKMLQEVADLIAMFIDAEFREATFNLYKNTLLPTHTKQRN